MWGDRGQNDRPGEQAALCHKQARGSAHELPAVCARLPVAVWVASPVPCTRFCVEDPHALTLLACACLCARLFALDIQPALPPYSFKTVPITIRAPTTEGPADARVFIDSPCLAPGSGPTVLQLLGWAYMVQVALVGCVIPQPHVHEWGAKPFASGQANAPDPRCRRHL